MILIFLLLGYLKAQQETLIGNLFCGYQAWFTTPSDGSSNGWTHFKMRSNQPFSANNCVFDLWPQTSEYQSKYRIEQFESPYYLFSPNDYSTVSKHFEWMKTYGIDGVFLQRFGSDIKNKGSNIYKFKNNVFLHVQKAAKEHSRKWALMYDLSGLQLGQIQSVIIQDWKFLNSFIDFRHDESYIRHKGKPLIAVWGVGFNDQRKYTLNQCLDLVDFLKNDKIYGENTVMVGVPRYWKNGGGDAVTGDQLKQLHNVILNSDVVSPWSVGRFRNIEGAKSYSLQVKQQISWCKQNNLEFLPVIFPGFSWHNLQKSGQNPDHPEPYNQIPRKQQGKYFLEEQGKAHIDAGAEMLYVAMFDEINEGTAIFKCQSNPPSLPDGLEFVPVQDPPQKYMQIAGNLSKSIKNKKQQEVQK